MLTLNRLIVDVENNSSFDVHMSFRRLNNGYWIPLSYINSNIKMFTVKGKSFSQRSNNISIFVSNNRPRNNRNKVMSDLSKYYPIYSFGQFTPKGTISYTNKFKNFFPQCESEQGQRSYFYNG